MIRLLWVKKDFKRLKEREPEGVKKVGKIGHPIDRAIIYHKMGKKIECNIMVWLQKCNKKKNYLWKRFL